MLGKRVVTPLGDVGVVEELDNGMAKVRLMTQIKETNQQVATEGK